MIEIHQSKSTKKIRNNYDGDRNFPNCFNISFGTLEAPLWLILNNCFPYFQTSDLKRKSLLRAYENNQWFFCCCCFFHEFHSDFLGILQKYLVRDFAISKQSIVKIDFWIKFEFYFILFHIFLTSSLFLFKYAWHKFVLLNLTKTFKLLWYVSNSLCNFFLTFYLKHFSVSFIFISFWN